MKASNPVSLAVIYPSQTLKRLYVTKATTKQNLQVCVLHPLWGYTLRWVNADVIGYKALVEPSGHILVPWGALHSGRVQIFTANTHTHTPICPVKHQQLEF